MHFATLGGSGYVLKDTCIIKAIREQGYGSVNDQEVSEVDSSPAQPIFVKEISSPSLVDDQRKRKRTRRFTE